MGDSSEKVDVTPKYGSPAAIGGSYIVDILQGKMPMVSGLIPRITSTDVDLAHAKYAREGKASPLVTKPPLGSAVSRKVHAAKKRPDKDRRDQWRTRLKQSCDELMELLTDSLTCEDGEEWRAFWVESIDEYGALFQRIKQISAHLRESVAVPPTVKVEDADSLPMLKKAFPDAADELDFLCSVMDSATEMAEKFEVVPEDKRPKDFEILARFNFWGAHFSMCLLTLDLKAAGLIEIRDALVPHVFVTARQAALEFNHAVMEGATLREAPEADQARTTTREFDESPIVLHDDLDEVHDRIRKFEAGD